MTLKRFFPDAYIDPNIARTINKISRKIKQFFFKKCFFIYDFFKNIIIAISTNKITFTGIIVIIIIIVIRNNCRTKVSVYGGRCEKIALISCNWLEAIVLRFIEASKIYLKKFATTVQSINRFKCPCQNNNKHPFSPEFSS